MRINHNIQALNAYRNLNNTTSLTSKSLEKLSSGLRINRAADDAAGLAISEKMRSQIRGLGMAERNSLDAISLIQTAEGALSSTHEILQRMRELSVQAANGTLEEADREAIQKEVNQLTSEINRIGNTTEFNTKKLLNSQLSPEARAVEIDEASFNAGITEVDGASVQLNPKSDLVDGNYMIEIKDVQTKNLNNLGGAAAGVSTVAIDPATSLPVGSYSIDIKQETVKVISSTIPAAGFIEDMSIATNSPASADVPVKVEIKRENTAGNFQPNATNLSGVTVVKSAPSAPEPNLSPANTFEVKVNVKASPIASGTAGGTFIESISINNPDSDLAGNGYQLVYEETAAASGLYKVTLYDGNADLTAVPPKPNGTAISQSVILDDNQQNYQFYDTTGNQLGISFKTVDDVNTGLAGAGANAKYNEFDADKEIALTKDGVELANKALIEEGTGAGTVTIQDGDITYEVAHKGFTNTQKGKAEFGIDSTLSYSVDGIDQGTLDLGNPGNVTLPGGIFVDFSNDIQDYQTGSNTFQINIGTADSFTAALVDETTGLAVADASKIAIDNNTTYSFGNGVSFSTGTLSLGERTFDIGVDTTVNAVLKTAGVTIDTLENISDDSSLVFNQGDLKVNIGALTNGSAAFAIKGGLTDSSIQLQIGANEGQNLKFGIKDMRAGALEISSTDPASTVTVTGKDGTEYTVRFTQVSDVLNDGAPEYAVDLSTTENAAAAIALFDQAIAKVSAERSSLGAIQNRLEHTITNLQTANENLTASESRIRDLDMAQEMTVFTKNNILNQAGQAMLAQANQLPQGILQLLQ